MKLQIENECIKCGTCEQGCPGNAISMIDGKYVLTRKNACLVELVCQIAQLEQLFLDNYFITFSTKGKSYV